jgi:3-oxoacyl-[acyl-carrier protein] reductase
LDLNLDGKRALATGSSAGIGAAIAKRLAREIMRVIVHGRHEARAETVAAALRAAGGEAAAVLGDLSSDEGAQHVFESARAAFGGIDILINNAGAYASRAWFDTTPQSWRAFYEEDVLSAVRMILLAAPAMRESGWGRIINVATGMATVPQPIMPDYAAAKAALVNASVSLAKELAGSGVTVNAISPGLIATDGVERVLREAAQTYGWGEDWGDIERRWMIDMLGNQLVLRLGTVDEVADLVAFIASPCADYIHGANLRIDGGLVPSIN